MARALAAVALLAGARAAAAGPTTVGCDVLVAGGSLASFAAAVTAANVTSKTVCFTDITDEPGGQLTASNVPAIDFGPQNKLPANQAAAFAAFLYGKQMPGGQNNGQCWVSTKCFLPSIAMEHFIDPLLASFPNLKVYLNTAVTGAARDATGRITSLSAVRRTPAAGTTGWEQLTSAMLEDWYSPAPSAAFPVKELLTLNVNPGGVVIEGTEFGDVMATAGIAFAQGPEAPFENSTSYLGSCGQGITLPFYLSYNAEVLPDTTPAGQCGADPSNCVPYSMQELGWDRTWSYRRVVAKTGGSVATQGEVSVINVGGGNDEAEAYIFMDLGSPQLQAQLQPGQWRGGINITSYALAENRSFAFYHFYKGNASASVGPYLAMNTTLTGTKYGLTKMPYLRDARRSPAGLGGFRVFYSDLHEGDPRYHNKTAFRWPDVVGLGVYFYADIHKMTNASCPYPDYLTKGSGAPVLPYYVPFRALTVDGAPNLLVVGKSLSTSFWANAAIRLHPEEYSTGAAAGAAAVLMATNGYDSAAMYANVAQLQALLVSDKVGVPLNWTLPNEGL